MLPVVLVQLLVELCPALADLHRHLLADLALQSLQLFVQPANEPKVLEFHRSGLVLILVIYNFSQS